MICTVMTKQMVRYPDISTIVALSCVCYQYRGNLDNTRACTKGVFRNKLGVWAKCSWAKQVLLPKGEDQKVFHGKGGVKQFDQIDSM